MTSRTLIPWLVGGLILTVYLATFATLPRGVFYSPDAGGKYLQMLGYHWANGLQCEIIYPGSELDPGYCFYGSHAGMAAFTSIYPFREAGGVTHTGWTPWFSLLTLPFYRAFGVTGLHAVPLGAGLLLIALAGMLAERLRPGSGLLAACVVGVGTPVLFYSLCFWEHTLAVSLALAALLPLVRARRGMAAPAVRPLYGCISGIGLLAACAVRRELIFFLGAGVLAWGWLHPRRRRYLPVVLLVLLTTGTGGFILLLVHPAPLRWLFPPDLGAVHWLDMLLTPALWQQAVPNGIRMLLLCDFGTLLPQPVRWTGVIGLAICLGNPLAPARWRRWMVLIGAMLVSVPAAWLVCTPVRYRALNSLLLPAPVALLALLPPIGPASAARRWLGWTVILFLGVFYLVLPAVVGGAHGGIEWGSRYSLVAIVLSTVLATVVTGETRAATGFSRKARAGVTVLAIWLVLLGAASAARGVHELRETRRDLLALQTELVRAGDPVVTDSWWLGASLAPFAATHEVYTLSARHPLGEWMAMVGPRRPRFSYVSERPADVSGRDGARWIQQECRSSAGLSITRFQRGPSP